MSDHGQAARAGGHRGAAPRRAHRSRRAGAARGPGAARDRRAPATALAVALGAARDGGRGAAGHRRGLPGHGWQPEVRPESRPSPTPRRIDLPADIGRDWEPDDLRPRPVSTWTATARGRRSSSSPSPRRTTTAATRLQTTLSSTGEEAYGLVELGTTIGISALDPIDADSDGDQELVLYTTAVDGRAAAHPSSRSSSTCATGCWSGRCPRTRELLASGDVVVPGSRTPALRDGARPDVHGRGRDAGVDPLGEAFARATGGMTLLRPETYVVDTWRLDPRRRRCPAAGGAGLPPCRCRRATRPCDADERRRPALRGDRVHGHHRRRGAGRDSRTAGSATARGSRTTADPNLVIDGAGGRTARSTRSRRPSPGSHVVSPASLVGFDAASVVRHVGDGSRCGRDRRPDRRPGGSASACGQSGEVTSRHRHRRRRSRLPHVAHRERGPS